MEVAAASPPTMARMAEPAPIDSSLPSTGARALALASIVLAGVCGGLIGWKVTDLQVTDAGALAGRRRRPPRGRDPP